MENNRNDKLAEWYDELFSKVDIVKIISSYVPLKKKGGSYWGCCPFHHEKTASFSVSDSKQLYYCFGCKEGGNALTFIKKIESLDTGDAIKILANEAGMQLPEKIVIRQGGEDTAKKRQRLYELMRQAAKHYCDNLFSGKAKAAGEYLNSRGIDRRLATKFGLGYSIDGTACIQHLKSLGYSESEMKDAGIAEMSANGWYDVLYDRLIIPIINPLKEVVAFGGRTLKPNPEFAKYKNSPQSLIFNKSHTVYGLNLVKALKLNGNLDYIIMTEGYMDVISLHKAGFDMAVASMGTSLTTNQARQVKNVCDKVYISYDGDAAGQQMTLRGLDILAQVGLNVKVICLPEGLDPDDVIKKYGASYYQKLIDQAQTLPLFKIDTIKKQYNLDDAEQKSRFAVEAIRAISTLENPVEREEYLKVIKGYTGYSMQVLLEQARITPAAPITIQRPAPISRGDSQSSKALSDAKTFVLACMASKLGYAGMDEDISYVFDDDFSSQLYTKLYEIVKDNLSITPLYEVFTDEYNSNLAKVLNYSFLKGDGESKFKDCVNNLKIAHIQRRQAQLKPNLDDMQAYKEYNELNEQLRAIKASFEPDED